ncbi:MAG TPA: hypothetical protein VG963_15985 [Polyangiaceae bacterium]|nr:hypothetical protein [Polyangiaceae bacterium]
MRERPILMSGPLVVSTLARLKTNTRRIVRKPKRAGEYSFNEAMERAAEEGWPGVQKRGPEDGIEWRVRCPYGVPGDRLWVREKHRYAAWTEDEEVKVEYAADGAHRWCQIADDGSGRANEDFWRWADGLPQDPENEEYTLVPKTNRPSIFMPRWASRLTLDVVGVRVERLQAISERDAAAEGLPRNHVGPPEEFDPDVHGWLTPAGVARGDYDCGEDGMTHWRGRSVPAWTTCAREAFAAWWDHINGKRATWTSNPWVWAIEFRVLAPAGSAAKARTA